MTIIEKIKAEIERLKSIGGIVPLDNREQKTGYNSAMIDIEAFLSTLESERPEPYNPVYDEAYLNEKIKKATESWKGVDVDAMLAECRGLDEEESEKPMQDGLEEEIDRLWESFADEMEGPHNLFDIYARLARHFAKWQKEQMLKEAVEGTVMDFSSNQPRPQVDVLLDPHKYHTGDKVRIIIVKED